MTAKILIGGHRGMGQTDDVGNRARAIAQNLPSENSLASFDQAFLKGADYVELDALASKDGQVFVSHSADGDLHRPPFEAKGEYNLTALTWAQLQHVKAGYNMQSFLPRLIEVMDLASRYRRKINIELKDVKGTDFPELQLDLIDLLAQLVVPCPV